MVAIIVNCLFRGIIYLRKDRFDTFVDTQRDLENEMLGLNKYISLQEHGVISSWKRLSPIKYPYSKSLLQSVVME